MSQFVVREWNRRHQKQTHQGAQDKEVEEGTTTTTTTTITSPHVHTQNLNLVPMSTKYEVGELRWENGEVAMHGVAGHILPPTTPTKSSWGSRMNNNNDTLESLVHQATIIPPHNPNLHSLGDCLNQVEMTKKRMRESVAEPATAGAGRSLLSIQDDCASASATFCWANDDTANRSLKTIPTAFDEEDSEENTKSSISARRNNRTAAVHNQSERRRRDRINQKLKTLQKLVPNASKIDKASILDEVIKYTKQLQAQIGLMMSRKNMNMGPQMMMQQHLNQMALLARMGRGMMDMSRNPAVPPPRPHLIPPFVPPPPFIVPPPIPKTVGAATNSLPFSDPYSVFLAQSMNMELYNKMAALYTQQANHQTKSGKLKSSLIHGQDH